MEQQALRAAFDADGKSFFETLTLPFYALIVPLVWLCCPFSGPTWRKVLLCAGVSCVAAMAVVKELDLHIAAMNALYPDVVANFKGTPFKMRFLKAHGVPIGAKALAAGADIATCATMERAFHLMNSLSQFHSQR